MGLAFPAIEWSGGLSPNFSTPLNWSDDYGHLPTAAVDIGTFSPVTVGSWDPVAGLAFSLLTRQ